MNRYADNIRLLQQISTDLINSNWLVRPVCYFDASVDEKKVKEYTDIIVNFGGLVVDEFTGSLDYQHHSNNNSGGGGNDVDASSMNTGDGDGSIQESTTHRKKKRKRSLKLGSKPKNRSPSPTPSSSSPPPSTSTLSTKPKVTHVIAWDDEEHDSPTTIQDEKTSPFAHNYDIVEKLYLRTITIIDPKKQKSTHLGGNIVETNMMETKKKGGRLGGKGKKGKSPNDASGNPLLEANMPLAFVHWWYLPESYDEFMLASDVDGDNGDVPPKPEGGPWVVGCKFIRDVERFNEWGLEADYAITDL